MYLTTDQMKKLIAYAEKEGVTGFSLYDVDNDTAKLQVPTKPFAEIRLITGKVEVTIKKDPEQFVL